VASATGSRMTNSKFTDDSAVAVCNSDRSTAGLGLSHFPRDCGILAVPNHSSPKGISPSPIYPLGPNESNQLFYSFLAILAPTPFVHTIGVWSFGESEECASTAPSSPPASDACYSGVFWRVM